MVIVAVGSNMKGPKGGALQTLRWAFGQMPKHQISIVAMSSLYATRPVGQPGQADYVNGAILVQTALSAPSLLKNLQRIEKKAGRYRDKMRLKEQWGPRPLDLDIIDYKGLVTASYRKCSCEGKKNDGGGVDRNRKCHLVLPHPCAHLRPFVIGPILDILPFWHHPVSGRSANAIWAGLRSGSDGQILRRVE